MSSRHRRKVSTIARQSAELALAAPEVMTHRLTRIYLSAGRPSKRESAELQRMATEKVAAVSAAWNAMAMELLRAYLRLAVFPTAFITSTSSRQAARALSAHTIHTAAAVTAAGLAPVHRRATSNVRRLRRSRYY